MYAIRSYYVEKEILEGVGYPMQSLKEAGELLDRTVAAVRECLEGFSPPEPS